ncbi:MAG: Ig-like domain-containing protein, partial [Candidatus Acidiferrales bacterium]
WQDSLTAQYSGDANYAGSTSSPTPVTVLYATQTSLTSSNPTVQHGASVTFTARISTPQTGAPPISGTVAFSYNGVQLGTVNVTNGQAQLTTSALPGGVFDIVGQYSGDGNFAPSIDFAPETVNLLNTITSVTTSNSVITQGSSITLTAMVAPAQSGGPALTGAVQFYYDFSAQGGDSIFIGSPVTLSNGQAQFTTSALPANILSVGAIYNGDSNYNGSGAQIPQTVNPAPTFTVTANPTTVPVPSPGQSGSTTLTFTSQNGFTSNGAATITPVCSGLPNGSLCSSGASVTILANGTATAMLTFSTMAPSSLAPRARYTPPNLDTRTPLEIITLACMFCLLMLALAARKVWIHSAILLVIACGLLVAASGCGGGGSGGGGGGGGGGNPGTLPGQYNITVTVTINGVTANAPIMLNVQ